jgi:hypothetical protein
MYLSPWQHSATSQHTASCDGSTIKMGPSFSSKKISCIGSTPCEKSNAAMNLLVRKISSDLKVTEEQGMRLLQRTTCRYPVDGDGKETVPIFGLL